MTTLIEKVWKRNLLQLVKIRFIYKLTMKKSSEKEMENCTGKCNNFHTLVTICSYSRFFNALPLFLCLHFITIIVCVATPHWHFLLQECHFSSQRFHSSISSYVFLSLSICNCMQCMIISFLSWHGLASQTAECCHHLFGNTRESLSHQHVILMLSLLFPILAVTVEKASPMGEGNFRNRSAPPCANSTVGVVKMTPLSFIPGAKITKYLGIINMFFIRETTSLREVIL